jgi:hypothetical protein
MLQPPIIFHIAIVKVKVRHRSKQFICVSIFLPRGVQALKKLVSYDGMATVGDIVNAHVPSSHQINPVLKITWRSKVTVGGDTDGASIDLENGTPTAVLADFSLKYIRVTIGDVGLGLPQEPEDDNPGRNAFAVPMNNAKEYTQLPPKRYSFSFAYPAPAPSPDRLCCLTKIFEILT